MRLFSSIVGQKKAEQKLRIAQKLAERGSRDWVDKSRRKAERSAKKKAPFRTGRLRASIRATSVDKGLGYTLGSDAKDDKGHPYAFWTEFGPTKQPWLFKTFGREKRYLIRRTNKMMIGIVRQLRIKI